MSIDYLSFILHVYLSIYLSLYIYVEHSISFQIFFFSQNQETVAMTSNGRK